MKSHQAYESWVPLYAAGQLPSAERTELERHLAGCAACRADLAFWQAVASEVKTGNRAIAAPSDLAERALVQVHARRSLGRELQLGWQMLLAQARLVQSELWTASAVVMAIGATVTLLLQQNGVIYFLAPLMAATSLALLYGPEHDPVVELALSTPTSPWKVLLARMTLVSAFNLALALAASLVFLAIVPPELFESLILAWLGPMTFLSALALLLSIWFGTTPALLVCYGGWLLQYQSLQLISLPSLGRLSELYQQFWHSGPLLFALAAALSAAALLSAGPRLKPLTRPGA